MNAPLNNRQEKRLKVLIAEAGDHYKILEQIYHLLHDKCELTFYIIDPRRYDYRELFPSVVKTRVLTCNLRGFPFFAWLLFYGARYDVINVSTGPDGSHYSEIVRIVFFYLCCLLYGRKIVLTLRNTHPYLESTRGLFAFIRSRGIRHVRRFTFETHTMRRVFAQSTARKDVLLGVSYDKYADATVPGDDRAGQPPRDGKVKIGLVGTVNEERRDYALICEALSLLSAEQRTRLMFVTLGQCNEGLDHPAMQRLSKLVEVDCRQGLLSELEFVVRGRACDLLMAPLTSRKAYGTLHGSGAFGDAVYLQKWLILPRHADREGEFAPLCIYYSDARELAEVLCSLSYKLDEPIAPDFLDQFRKESVYAALVEDLRLC